MIVAHETGENILIARKPSRYAEPLPVLTVTEEEAKHLRNQLNAALSRIKKAKCEPPSS